MSTEQQPFQPSEIKNPNIARALSGATGITLGTFVYSTSIAHGTEWAGLLIAPSTLPLLIVLSYIVIRETIDITKDRLI